jgi:hypothetical protein
MVNEYAALVYRFDTACQSKESEDADSDMGSGQSLTYPSASCTPGRFPVSSRTRNLGSECV